MPRIYRKGAKIVKTMIYLEEEAHKRLKHMAVDKEVSMTELMRQAVDEYLAHHSSGKGKGG